MGWKSKVWSTVLPHLPLKKPSIRYCVDRKMLPEVFVGTPSATLREQLFLPAHEQTTQLNQDIFGLMSNRFRSGFFVEIGANDGKTFSNTIYLEEKFGWKGLLVEPNPRYKESLETRTSSAVCLAAVAEHEGQGSFSDAGLYGGLTDSLDPSHDKVTSAAATIEVPCKTVRQIFEEHDVPDVIDFLSLDVEGGELTILRQLVADGRRIRSGCVELNHRTEDLHEARQLLEDANYEIVWQNQTAFDWFFIDPALVR